MTSWKTKKLHSFAQALQSLKTEEELLAFLRDVATIEELKSLSERWDAARRIANGDSYREIAKKTGLSTATVTRVAHWLRHGMGGYTKAIARIHKG